MAKHPTMSHADGPKGPRRKCQFGAVYLASRTGLPIVPVGFGYSRCWRADNWDRFALPLLFSRVRGVSAHPVRVPPKLMANARDAARTYGKSDPIDALAVARAALREPDLPAARLDGPAREATSRDG